MKCLKPIPRSRREWILWITVLIIVCGTIIAVDYFDGNTSNIALSLLHNEITQFDWAGVGLAYVAALIAIYGLYVVTPYIVYHNAKRNKRNAIRWTTAFILFTPILGGIAYLLTWPKGQE